MKFYSDIRKALRTNGIFATHTTGVSYTPSEYIYTDIVKILTDIFPLTDFYYEYIPSFSSLWGFAACSQKYSPRKISPDTVYKRLKKRNLDSISYYDKETHTRLFHLPRLLRNFRCPPLS
jgi:spermidine synthase